MLDWKWKLFIPYQYTCCTHLVFFAHCGGEKFASRVRCAFLIAVVLHPVCKFCTLSLCKSWTQDKILCRHWCVVAPLTYAKVSLQLQWMQNWSAVPCAPPRIQSKMPLSIAVFQKHLVHDRLQPITRRISCGNDGKAHFGDPRCFVRCMTLFMCLCAFLSCLTFVNHPDGDWNSAQTDADTDEARSFALFITIIQRNEGVIGRVCVRQELETVHIRALVGHPRKYIPKFLEQLADFF